MFKSLESLRKRRESGEGGFTLIELLVVIAIIGILAAIAIPVFLNQRNTARDASVKSDINTVAKLMETHYTDYGQYPGVEGLQELNAQASDGNTVMVRLVTADGVPSGATDPKVGFVICASNLDSGKAFVYTSVAGGLYGDPATGTCAEGITVPADTWTAAHLTGAVSVTGTTVS